MTHNTVYSKMRSGPARVSFSYGVVLCCVLHCGADGGEDAKRVWPSGSSSATRASTGEPAKPLQSSCASAIPLSSLLLLPENKPGV